MTPEEANVASAFISPISYIICFIGLLSVLAMLKSFISHAISIAITEWLLNHNDEESRMKIVRWWTNGEAIMKAIERLEKKMQATPDSED